jgi:hypothetical protein
MEETALDRDISREISLHLAKRFELLNQEHLPNYMTISFALSNFVGYVLARMNTDYIHDAMEESGKPLSDEMRVRLHQASLQWFCEVLALCYQHGWATYGEGDEFDDWDGL